MSILEPLDYTRHRIVFRFGVPLKKLKDTVDSPSSWTGYSPSRVEREGLQCLDPALKAQQLAISGHETGVMNEGRGHHDCIGQSQAMVLAQRNHLIEEPAILVGKVDDRHAPDEIGKQLRILRGEIRKSAKLDLGDDGDSDPSRLPGQEEQFTMTAQETHYRIGIEQAALR